MWNLPLEAHHFIGKVSSKVTVVMIASSLANTNTYDGKARCCECGAFAVEPTILCAGAALIRAMDVMWLSVTLGQDHTRLPDDLKSLL